MAAGAALLIASDVEVGSARTASLAQRLRRVGDVLLATGADWRVSRLSMAATPRGRSTLERELDEVARHGPLALVAASGPIVETQEGPALLLAESFIGSDDVEALPLREISARLRVGTATHAVVVLGAWGDGASSAWLDALDTGRPGDLIAVGAAGSAGGTIEALQEALAGAAIDLGTGTVTLRSLGAYLVNRVKDLALRASSDASTWIVPPPLAGAWDPRLTRRTVAAGGLHGAGGSYPVAAEPGDLTGTILPGRFRLDALIATGGFGAVYRARQLSVERDVAVKVLSADVDSSSQSGRLFVQRGPHRSPERGAHLSS